ncbi:MAG: hypothetical protein P1V20_24580 [Verrucomicrobiales bacterium]|nr:hypothetical protein [Verrucomicrobiales bacterium]
MKNDSQKTGWKRDEDSFVDKIWIRSMMFLAVSVLTCMIPLLPKAPETDGIIVRSGEDNPQVKFQTIEKESIFARLRKPRSSTLARANSVAAQTAIAPASQVPSIPEQLKQLHPALIALPAAQIQYSIETGEIRKRIAEAKAKAKVGKMIDEAYRDRGVDSAIFRELEQ